MVCVRAVCDIISQCCRFFGGVGTEGGEVGVCLVDTRRDIQHVFVNATHGGIVTVSKIGGGVVLV